MPHLVCSGAILAPSVGIGSATEIFRAQEINITLCSDMDP